jgi:hypothetical protein
MVHGIMKSIYDLMQIRICYGSIWPKIGIVQQILMKASHVEF